MDSRLPGSSVHGIFQARVLEWGAISFSRGSSSPRVGTQVSLPKEGNNSLWSHVLALFTATRLLPHIFIFSFNLNSQQFAWFLSLALTPRHFSFQATGILFMFLLNSMNPFSLSSPMIPLEQSVLLAPSLSLNTYFSVVLEQMLARQLSRSLCKFSCSGNPRGWSLWLVKSPSNLKWFSSTGFFVFVYFLAKVCAKRGLILKAGRRTSHKSTSPKARGSGLYRIAKEGSIQVVGRKTWNCSAQA